MYNAYAFMLVMFTIVFAVDDLDIKSLVLRIYEYV